LVHDSILSAPVPWLNICCDAPFNSGNSGLAKMKKNSLGNKGLQRGAAGIAQQQEQQQL